MHRIQTLQSSLLLLLWGAAVGIMPSLSRMASGEGSNPYGLAVWVDACAAFLCFVLVLPSGRFPKLSRSDVMFFVYWAFLVGILQHLVIFVLAEHVEATFLTMVLALQSLMVFGYVSMTGMEAVAARRILGLLVGLGGIGLGLYQRFEIGGSTQNFWLFASLAAPAFYAVENVALSKGRPEHVNPITSVALMFFFSTLLAAPIAFASGNLIPVSAIMSELGVIIVFIAVFTIAANVTLLYLIKMAGPVFASQGAYVAALTGIVWGMLLLGETMSPLAWGALVLVLIGMYLVEAKPSDEPIIINRKFTA